MDTSSVPLKQCSRREKCVNPLGSWLPNDAKHFRARIRDGKSTLNTICFACDRYKSREYQRSADGKAKRKLREARPEVKEANRLRAREYRSSPEIKQLRRVYRQLSHAKAAQYQRQQLLGYKAKRREYLKDYRARPEVKERERLKRWSRKQTPKYKEYARNYDREYRATEHGKRIFILAAGRRRTRKRNLPNTLTVEQWEHALSYFGNQCAFCGRPPGLWHILAQEHWIPLSDPNLCNPGTVAHNILPVCHSTSQGQGGCNNSKRNLNPIEWLNRRFGRRKATAILLRITEYFESLNTQAP